MRLLQVWLFKVQSQKEKGLQQRMDDDSAVLLEHVSKR